MPSVRMHAFQYIAIADRRALQGDAFPRQSLLETEIAHEGADDAAMQRTATAIVERNHVQQLIAVVRASLTIDHHEAIAVAVQANADIRAMLDHLALQMLRMRR